MMPMLPEKCQLLWAQCLSIEDRTYNFWIEVKITKDFLGSFYFNTFILDFLNIATQFFLHWIILCCVYVQGVWFQDVQKHLWPLLIIHQQQPFSYCENKKMSPYIAKCPRYVCVCACIFACTKHLQLDKIAAELKNNIAAYVNCSLIV